MLLETLFFKKKKWLCHPHSWNVMHAVHRVCFKWEAEKGGGGGGGELFRRARVHGGLLLEVGSARLKKMKHKTHFPSSSSSSKNTLLH